MKVMRWAIPILSCLILSGLTTAGELSEKLQGQVKSASPDEMIDVWIKLPPISDGLRFKNSVNAASSTRAGRYTAALSQLRSGHQSAQRDLLNRLDQLRLLGKAQNVKPHWVTNIVEARLAADQLEELARRRDVEIVVEVPKVLSIPATKFDPSPSMAATVQSNLIDINANLAWAAGYTGAGRVICSFDTGIEGDHPALVDNWKGQDGDSAAAWFDPRFQDPFPHYIPNCGLGSLCQPNHGTHVMGIMVGHDDGTGDTVGVALDAKWISAAVIDVVGTSILDAFEWAADPDGDPNTVDDVPDVINHSWGVSSIGCTNIFFDLIDNLEAMGIVNIFASGNEGSAFNTIRNPANRANDSLDCFAVGSANHQFNPPEITAGSSRGPSDCNGAIKPNVSAPGGSIRSSIPGPSYAFMGGTSMATPHVSGLVALLRQKNPNATVDQIKEAILTSAVDIEAAGPDNEAGWGYIDCMAALNALPAQTGTAELRISGFTHAALNPGDTAQGTVVLRNIGGGALSAVTGNILDSNPALTIVEGLLTFGSIAANSTKTSAQSIRIAVSDTIVVGTVLPIDLRVTDGVSYTDTLKLYLVVEPKLQRSIATHTAGRAVFSLSNFGTFGFADDSFFPLGGAGFEFDGSGNDLFEAGLLVGRSATQVSDGVRNAIGEWDGDFSVQPGGNIEIQAPGTGAAEETVSRMSDDRAENPVGVTLTQRSYGFTSGSASQTIVLRYDIKNTGIDTLANVFVGLYLDWDIINYTFNSAGWDATNKFAWMAYRPTTVNTQQRGVAILDGTPASVYVQEGIDISYPSVSEPSLDGFTELEKYTALSDGFTSADTTDVLSADFNHTVSVGPYTLRPGETGVAAFALVGGVNMTEALAGVTAANAAYDAIPLAPTGPVCLYPLETSEKAPVDATPTFRWSPSYDSNPTDVLRYRIEYDTDPDFGAPTVVSNLVDTFYTAVTPLQINVQYFWRVFAYDQTARETKSANTPSFIPSQLTDVGGPGDGNLPVSFALYQNYPNPFNPTTTISFDLPQPAEYELVVYNVLGQEVRRFAGRAISGRTDLEWDASGVASGLYVYRLTAGENTSQKKMLLLK